MPNDDVPSVYIEETPITLKPISRVKTATTAFIGYTEKATKNNNNLTHIPTTIHSLLEYENLFGKAQNELSIVAKINHSDIVVLAPPKNSKSPFLMYYSIQSFFANGGTTCIINSVGQFANNQQTLVKLSHLSEGLSAIKKINGVTLLLFPDATSLPSDTEYYTLCNNVLGQCKTLKDRFALLDAYSDNSYTNDADILVDPIEALREGIRFGKDYLRNAAVYFPFIKTTLSYTYDNKDIDINLNGHTVKLSELELSDIDLYQRVITQIHALPVILPPSSIVAGIYSRVDNKHGVWKASANIRLINVSQPTVAISNQQHNNLNLDPVAGKSINVIKAFPNKGVVVWGAKTLAGNDHDWRYIPVRRLTIMIEQSIKKFIDQYIFDLNSNKDRTNIRISVEHFLITLWREGALIGSKSEDAFYVNMELNDSMTGHDASQRKLAFDIGLAIIKPSEFIPLTFDLPITLPTAHSATKIPYQIPLHSLHTKQKWKNIRATKKTWRGLKKIKKWLKNTHKETSQNTTYLALFSGSSSTERTIIAALIGKTAKKIVYSVDLSSTKPQDYHATQRAFKDIFEQALKDNAILFFDEADALFAKQTPTKDVQNKYANQEVSYLLQRIEHHPGLIIISVNEKRSIAKPLRRQFNDFLDFSPLQAT